MLQPNEITTLRQAWGTSEPADDLADRIIAHALAQPQQRSLMARLRAPFAAPTQRFAMRGMAVAACLMIAVLAIDTGKPTPKATSVKYKMPMEQIVEDLIWNDYSY